MSDIGLANVTPFLGFVLFGLVAALALIAALWAASRASTRRAPDATRAPAGDPRWSRPRAPRRTIARAALLLILAPVFATLVAAASLVALLVSSHRSENGSSSSCAPELPPPPSRPPRPVPGGGAESLGLGGDRSCAAMRDGSVWCWGDDRVERAVAPGELPPERGLASTASFETLIDAAAEAARRGGEDGDRDGGAREASSAGLTCVVQSGGTVDCTGAPGGDGIEVDTATMHAFPAVGTATDVIVDPYEWCIQLAGKDWRCWPRVRAYSADARRAPSDWPEPGPPAALPDAHSVVGVVQNRFALCTMVAGGDARCRARGLGGALGEARALPAVRRLAVGNTHACAVDRSGQLLCWGANESGESSPTLRSPSVPDPGSVLPSPAIGAAGDVAVGLRHTCAVTRDGAVVCFGDNRAGQLGTGTVAAVRGLAHVSGLEARVARVTAGFDHTCVLTEAGTVLCWGHSDPVPRTIDARGPVTSIAAAADRTCALRADRTVACWNAGSEHAAESVAGTAGTEEIGVGDSHACVRTHDGRVRCWGSNRVGQAPAAYEVHRDEWTLPHTACPEIKFTRVREAGALDVLW